MSLQLNYVQSYAAMVRAYLAAYPEDEAVARSVGGNLEHFGVLEHSLLRQYGLKDNGRVVDVGCGAGRLAAQLRRFPEMRYLGLDVVPELLDYCRRKMARPDFRLELSQGNRIPLADGEADFVIFFSVFTHLLHEESYVYLEQAHRVLAPGGRVIFSFFEFAVESQWSVFEGNADWVRKRSYLGHINVFMHAEDLRLWAKRLGFTVVAMERGDRPSIEVTPDTAAGKVPAGQYPLGQSYCVLEKPAG
ncbi:class I SAM-dependent methyltransferase [Belnapia rosea]|uniref:Ubiquinone/menaquinone biosynthesis C-methylase UbiE n=1 Tax=Belnapia rosea TaxID=938405 RepID=A0A1G6P4B7_9PROT|nr:class I SAM-dependent methyltransferase [Belnapia rosea]SDB53136.1 Ubiquinone/menaquinone biosynthesis C-methylase UbiE [Belnapia rosea]SDC74781.1 Ubiquinone/menaquinone biosynthesis C-methylase UbiE [Belnapia rosea]